MSPATLEALETAWYAQDFPEVERLALEALAATPGEAEATGWLGLASDAKEGDPLAVRARLAAVAAELARAEAAGEASAVYRRYCGEG